MNKKTWVFTISGFVIVLVMIFVWFNLNHDDAPENPVTPNIKQLVHEYSVGTFTDQSASITSQQLIVTDSKGDKRAYALPKDEFFVSIAPYIDHTHPCAIHSLTGCQGEMTNQEFEITIEDIDGSEVLNKTLKSQANGFIDLWLPRDKAYRISITYDGKKAESTLSTFEGDNTCITTLQLS